MKMFDQITENVEALADAMTREARSAMRITVEGIAEELLKCDFSDAQKHLIRTLAEYINQRNDMRSVRLWESYQKWLNREIEEPADEAETVESIQPVVVPVSGECADVEDR